MKFELQPRSVQGRKFVALAVETGRLFAAGADAHDRENSYAADNIATLRKCGLAAATVPIEFGGLGVESLVDFAAGINRLGRYDGATALAANMHIFLTWFVARDWRRARDSGDAARTAQWERMLREIGGGRMMLAALVTEPGHDLLHPVTEARRVAGGWRLTGRKAFATGSPTADVLIVTCRHRDDDGAWRAASAYLPAGTDGIRIKHDWDALGMRASGSHQVELEDCFVADAAFIDRGLWGAYDEDYLAGNYVGTLGLVSVFLGIAEAASDTALQLLHSRRASGHRRPAIERAGVQHIVSEIEIDLAASRAMMERTAAAMDSSFTAYPGDLPVQEMHEVMKDFQCTKWFVTRKAIETVDRALSLSGGAGYMSKNSLSRLYRDVRAGPFMQPFSPNEVFEYIAKVTLGLDPQIDL